MENNIEKEFLKKQNITERISFKDGKPHTFRIIKRKLDTINNQGVVLEGIKYMVNENGEAKTFFTKAISLIQLLSEIKDGQTIIVQMKSKPNGQGGFTSYFAVSYPQSNEPIKTEDIPIFEEDIQSEKGEVYQSVDKADLDW